MSPAVEPSTSDAALTRSSNSDGGDHNAPGAAFSRRDQIPPAAASSEALPYSVTDNYNGRAAAGRSNGSPTPIVPALAAGSPPPSSSPSIPGPPPPLLPTYQASSFNLPSHATSNHIPQQHLQTNGRAHATLQELHPASTGTAPLPPHNYSYGARDVVDPSNLSLRSSSLLPAYAASISSSAPSAQPPAHLIQHLARQNDAIRDAWKAERIYLEANRRRAEEVYQEERAIMDEMQDAWESERAALLRENRLLKERVRGLEAENRALRSSPSPSGNPRTVTDTSTDTTASASASVSASASGPAASSTPLSPPHYGPPIDSSALPPGLDGAARRPYHISHVGSGTPHTAAPASSSEPPRSSVLPLDPRMQPQTRNPRDFLAREAIDGEEADAVIDIHEVDPKLDGIPLRATAVQRLAFFGQSSRTSAATSPPPPAGRDGPEPDDTHDATGDANDNNTANNNSTSDSKNLLVPQNDPRQGMVKRNSSRDSTIQALHAEESRRLTMHAGHTPNHSLSLFPTMSVAEGSVNPSNQVSNAASQGPSTHGPGTPPREGEEQHGKPREESTSRKGSGDGASPEGPAVHVTFDGPAPESKGSDHQDDWHDEPEERFEPANDARLKGPLMVKNIPAQDEIFWDQLNKKLEPISQGQGSIPAAMMVDFEGDDPAADGGPPHDSNKVAEEAPASKHGHSKSIEDEVPLKIRSTTNFGAPFGVV